MAKKRGKSKAKSSSRKPVKKAKAARKSKAAKPAKVEPQSYKDVLKDLDVFSEGKKVEQKVGEVEKKEEALEKKEIEIMKEEKKIERETQKVEGLEKKIVKEVEPKPLSKFNARDLNKGIIGAFIGVVAHFGFIYGKAIAGYISTLRATLLILFSYLLLIILMYETGYRDIKEKRLLGILPKRATIIFFTSLFVVVIIFILFGMLDFSKPLDMYKQIAVTSVLAALGAGTADLLGKH